MRNVIIGSLAIAGAVLATAALGDELSHAKRPQINPTNGLEHVKQPLITVVDELSHAKRPQIAVA
jgi:hypothetical protein